MKVLIGIFALMTLLAGGCASNIAVDYDQQVEFSQFKTYALFAPDIPHTGQLQLDSPMVAKRIKTAIERQLQINGYHRAAQNPDFLVTYHLQVKQEVTSRGSGISWGLGASQFGHHGGTSITYVTPAYSIYSYDKGILTIDILLPDEKTLVWRGSTGRRLPSAATPQESEDAINKVVEKILSRFPPDMK